MLIRDEVENAVHLQACGYQLLKWLEKALTDGFITPEAALSSQFLTWTNPARRNLAHIKFDYCWIGSVLQVRLLNFEEG